MVFIKQAMEPRCKLRHRKCRPNSKIQIKKKAIKENRREIRESLTVMVISSVHDHDKNYDHDVDDDIGMAMMMASCKRLLFTSKNFQV